MTHFCSDRVTHRRRRAFVRKPKVGKAISSPPKAGCWVRFREQSRVISRECRRTNAFSKKIENHMHSVALFYMHYNFVRIHQTLRVTPAMAAGVTARLWSVADIVAMTEAASARRAA